MMLSRRLSAGLVLSLIAGTKTLTFHAEVIFKNHKIFWETCYDKPVWRSSYTSWTSWHSLLHENHWKTLLRPEISPRIPPSEQIDHPRGATIFHYLILPDLSHTYFSEQHTSFPLSFSVHFYLLPVFLLNKTSHLLFHNYTSSISFSINPVTTEIFVIVLPNLFIKTRVDWCGIP